MCVCVCVCVRVRACIHSSFPFSLLLYNTQILYFVHIICLRVLLPIIIN